MLYAYALFEKKRDDEMIELVATKQKPIKIMAAEAVVC